MSLSGSANKGLAAQALHRVNSGGLVRTPSVNRSITPRTRVPRVSGSTSAPKLGASTSSHRTPQNQNATPKSIQTRTSLSRQTPTASPPRRSRPIKSIEPLRRTGSLTPRPGNDCSHRYRDSKALALLAKQLDEFSRRRYQSFMHGVIEAWQYVAHKRKLSHDKIVPLCVRLWRDGQRQVLAQIVNSWARFALRERALRAERQLAAERAALRFCTEELYEVRERLREAETRDDAHVPRLKRIDLERVEEWDEMVHSRHTKEEEAPSETDPVTEAEAEAEPTPAEPEPQPPSLNRRPHAQESAAIPNDNKDTQEFCASADKLEERVGAMISELNKPASLPWPETPRVDATEGAQANAIPDSTARACAADGSVRQQRKAESTRDSPPASMRVGSFPGRALLRRLAGPKLAGGKRRGLLDSSSDSD